VLRRLEALLVVADATHGYVISGSGELIEPDDDPAIGSAVLYALASGGRCWARPALRQRRRCQRSLEIAGRHLHLTNTHITVLEL